MTDAFQHTDRARKRQRLRTTSVLEKTTFGATFGTTFGTTSGTAFGTTFGTSFDAADLFIRRQICAPRREVSKMPIGPSESVAFEGMSTVETLDSNCLRFFRRQNQFTAPTLEELVTPSNWYLSRRRERERRSWEILIAQ